MSEFFGFYATRMAKIDRKKVKAALKKLKVDAVLYEGKGWLYLNSPSHKSIVKFADVMLHVFDHEGSAWDFEVYQKGKRIGGAIMGENAETGAEDQGFTGDLAATAKALQVDAKKLQKTFVRDSKAFLKLLALEWHGAPETAAETPKGQNFFDELDFD